MFRREAAGVRQLSAPSFGGSGSEASLLLVRLASTGLALFLTVERLHRSSIYFLFDIF